MNVMRTKLAGIAAAVVLAGAGTAVLVGYVNGAEDRALKGEKATNVLVVSDTIPKGTPVSAIGDKVKVEKVPEKVKAVGAVASLGALTGQVAVVDLLPGEQVVQTRFAAVAQAGTPGVAAGSLQVTVALDAVRAMGGQIREGDTVAVVASFPDPDSTHIILHKVRVTGVHTAAGAAVKSKAGEATLTGSVLVTLALDAASVERVIYTAEFGRLWLTAEPTEANEGGTKVQTRGSVNG